MKQGNAHSFAVTFMLTMHASFQRRERLPTARTPSESMEGLGRTRL